MLRPEQGYPLRLPRPGYEGNMNIGWLRRLNAGGAGCGFAGAARHAES